MPLCPSYQRFSIYSFTSDPDGVRAYRLAAVEEGARNECEFCLLLLEELKDDLKWLPYPQDHCWVRFSLEHENIRPIKDGPGLKVNKICVVLGNRPYLKPQLRSLDDEVSLQHELSVAADTS